MNESKEKQQKQPRDETQNRSPTCRCSANTTSTPVLLNSSNFSRVAHRASAGIALKSPSAITTVSKPALAPVNTKICATSHHKIPVPTGPRPSTRRELGCADEEGFNPWIIVFTTRVEQSEPDSLKVSSRGQYPRKEPGLTSITGQTSPSSFWKRNADQRAAQLTSKR